MASSSESSPTFEQRVEVDGRLVGFDGDLEGGLLLRDAVAHERRQRNRQDAQDAALGALHVGVLHEHCTGERHGQRQRERPGRSASGAASSTDRERDGGAHGGARVQRRPVRFPGAIAAAARPNARRERRSARARHSQFCQEVLRAQRDARLADWHLQRRLADSDRLSRLRTKQ